MFTEHLADFTRSTSKFEVRDRLRRPCLTLVQPEMYKKKLRCIYTSVSTLNLYYVYLKEYLLLAGITI
jgi:hypothetical protein